MLPFVFGRTWTGSAGEPGNRTTEPQTCYWTVKAAALRAGLILLVIVFFFHNTRDPLLTLLFRPSILRVGIILLREARVLRVFVVPHKAVHSARVRKVPRASRSECARGRGGKREGERKTGGALASDASANPPVCVCVCFTRNSNGREFQKYGIST